MNDQRRIRLLTGLVVALVLLNIGLLSWLWLRPARPDVRGNRLRERTFLADTLRFSPGQRQQLTALQRTYFQQMKPQLQTLRQARRAYFRLTDSSLTEAQRRDRLLAFHRQATGIDLLTLAHFDRIAAICTPDQRALLNQLMSKLPERAFRMPRSRRSNRDGRTEARPPSDSIR